MRRKSVPLLLFVIILQALLTLSAVATDTTETVRKASWAVYHVGRGVVAKTCHFDDLFGGQQDVYVTDADMNVAGVSLRLLGQNDGTRKIVSDWAAVTSGTAAVINGAWFDVHTGLPQQFLRIGGLTLARTIPIQQDRGGIVISAKGRVSCPPRPNAGWDSLSDPSIMASAVPEVVDGRPYLWTTPGKFDYKYYYVDRHPRSAIGVTADNHLLFVVVDGRRLPVAIGATYAEMAELLIALGAKNATELDGGGSSTMWGRDYGVFNVPSDGHERPVASALCLVAVPTANRWAARFIDAAYQRAMPSDSTQTVTLRFANTGTKAWSRRNTYLGTTMPRERASAFFRAGTWISPARPSRLQEATVKPGQVGSFQFDLKAPDAASTQALTESFAPVRRGLTWFGLAKGRMNWLSPDRNMLTIVITPKEQASKR